jgi:benzaldehyde dehydrogenase (NAD)
MAELLDDLDWQGKVYSSGWTTSRGGVLESTEAATGEVLATVGLADASDVAAAASAGLLILHPGRGVQPCRG